MEKDAGKKVKKPNDFSNKILEKHLKKTSHHNEKKTREKS